MKVVLFCGGLGLRVRELSQEIPKAMLRVGHRPVLWHVMKYYAYYGHKDFILCLGYQADVIKQYFLGFKDVQSNNFILSRGGKHVQELPSEIDDWTITCVDTGLSTNIGQRLQRVQSCIGEDEYFLANYADNLTSAPLDKVIDALRNAAGKSACFLCVRPRLSFHVVSCSAGGGKAGPVEHIKPVEETDIWINGGYFVFRRDVFDYLAMLQREQDLVPDGLNLLLRKDKLIAWRHEGFWAPMDTPKDMRLLDEQYTTGKAEWAKWE